MSRYRFGAILLAAGRSIRFGAGQKLLALYRGKPLLSHALGTLHGLDVAHRVVVIGAGDPEIAALVAGSDAEIVTNARTAEGMGTSIAAGIAALRPGTEAAFVLLGDMPAIAVTDVEALAAAFDPTSGKTICLPVHRGQRGHPVLFGRDHFDALLALTGDRGARAILDANPRRVAEVATGNAGVLFDCDLPEDFASA